MSGFNWSAFGDPGGHPDEPVDPARGRRPPDFPTTWDFSLAPDASDLAVEAMNRQVEELIDAAGELQAYASDLVADAWDSGHLVHVIVNAAGVVTATELADDAMRRSTPHGLAAAFTEAAQAAAADVLASVDATMSPLRAVLEHIDDTVPMVDGVPDASGLEAESEALTRRLRADPRRREHSSRSPRRQEGAHHDR